MDVSGAPKAGTGICDKIWAQYLGNIGMVNELMVKILNII